jgi:hypothetical protein
MMRQVARQEEAGNALLGDRVQAGSNDLKVVGL